MQEDDPNQHIFHENPPDGIKELLMNKYRDMFVDKLTQQDLLDLQFYLRNQFDEKRQIDAENKLKFESILRRYFHEEIMRREIVSIEALLSLLKPEDLKIQDRKR